MPLLIKHIDAIAREKQRGVLFVAFRSENEEGDADEDFSIFPPSIDWENLGSRKQLIAWLDENGIPWLPCGDVANPNLMISYQGQLYIDVPFDTSIPKYQKLAAYLENPDGSMRHPGVNFHFLSLDVAMKNKEHDEPGYWERWAESF